MNLIETIARAIAAADQEDYMEDCQRYDARAEAAIDAIRLRSAEAWAVHNSCQGVFTCGVAHSKKGAEDRLRSGDYDGAGCTVVPVRVLVEPEEKWLYREWQDRELHR